MSLAFNNAKAFVQKGQYVLMNAMFLCFFNNFFSCFSGVAGFFPPPNRRARARYIDGTSLVKNNFEDEYRWYKQKH